MANSVFGQELKTKKILWVLIHNNPEKSEVEEIEKAKVMRQHMDYLSKIHHEEKMLASMSFQGGGGLMFFNSPEDSVKKWMKSDPAISKNFYDLTYFTWFPEKGSICRSNKKANLSNVFLTFLKEDQEHNLHDGHLDQVMEDLQSLINQLKLDQSTLCLGRIKDGYAIVSDNEEGLQKITEFVQNSSGMYFNEVFKAWVNSDAFCE